MTEEYMKGDWIFPDGTRVPKRTKDGRTCWPRNTFVICVRGEGNERRLPVRALCETKKKHSCNAWSYTDGNRDRAARSGNHGRIIDMTDRRGK